MKPQHNSKLWAFGFQQESQVRMVTAARGTIMSQEHLQEDAAPGSQGGGRSRGWSQGQGHRWLKTQLIPGGSQGLLLR